MINRIIGSRKNAATTTASGSRHRRTKRRWVIGYWAKGAPAECRSAIMPQDDALMHFCEVAVREALLHRLKLRPIDTFCAGVIGIRQEFGFHRLRQLDGPRRTQISIGPDRLPLVGQQIVE